MAKTRKTVQRFTIGGRTYELVSFLKKGESSVRGAAMLARAKKLGASLGEEDGAFILKRQNKIPQELRGKFYLVFAAWRDLSYPKYVACLHCRAARWYRSWDWLGRDWFGDGRLVRRIA